MSDTDDSSIDFQEEFTEFVRDLSSDRRKTYIDNTFYIDSRDRNVGTNSKTFEFAVKFSDTISAVEARIPRTLSRVLEFGIKDIIIPNFYLNLKECHFLYSQNLITSYKKTTNSNNLRPQRLADLPYIILNINDIGNNHVSGTNNNLVQASFILKIQDTEKITNQNSGNYLLNGNRLVEIGNINNSILAETDKNRLRFTCKEKTKLQFTEVNAKTITTLSMSLTDPNGNKLEYLNDYLIINSSFFIR